MQFLYPNVLLFILIPTIVLMFLITTNKDKFQRHFSKDVLSKLTVKNKYMTKTTRNVLFFIALILMTISLARPVLDEKEHSLNQETAALVIALDVSKSMLATDIFPNRLTFGKKKIIQIIDYAKENSIAVILFAKSSFVLSPVTQDFNSLKILVNRLDTGINFDNGSNIFSTLEASKKLLKDFEDKNLILISDGGNESNYEKEIEFASKNGIKIYTLGLATNNPTPIKLKDNSFLTKDDGSIVTVKLNEKIKNLSLNTNAAYIEYTNSSQDIEQIIDDINANSSKQKQKSRKFKTYTELFYYPLALALLFLLIAFSSKPEILRKNKNLLVLLVSFFFVFNTQSKAFEFDFKTIDKAKEYYQDKKYEKASNEFRKVAKTPESHYNLGNSLYKQKEYKKALMHYQKVVSSNQDLEHKKLHNMGNSFVKLNDLENAKRVYEKALKIKDDEQTKENLEAVLNALNKKDNKQKNKNQQDKNSQNNEEQKEKQNKENEEEDKDKEKKNNQKEQKENENNKSKKEKKENELSDAEERKWLKKLENQKKTPVMLKKVDTKNKSDNTSTPW